MMELGSNLFVLLSSLDYFISSSAQGIAARLVEMSIGRLEIRYLPWFAAKTSLHIASASGR